MKRITAILITVILSGVFLASLVFAGVGAPPYNPANVKITGGTINGASVGVTTPGAGAFSTLTANSNPTVGQTNSIARLSVKSIAVNGGAGQSEIYLSSSTTPDRSYLSYSHLLETLRVGVVGTTVGNFTSTGLNATQIGATTTSTGAFTTLSASSTVSGAGFSTYLASPPGIGSTTPSTGAFTTLSASSTVSGTGFSTYLASPPAIGSAAPSTGKFTSIDSTTDTRINGKLLISATAPTISSGFGTSPNISSSNGTAAFVVVVGTGGTASSGQLTFPAAYNGWACKADAAAFTANTITINNGSSTTVVNLTNYTISTGAAVAWPAGTNLYVTCLAF